MSRHHRPQFLQLVLLLGSAACAPSGVRTTPVPSVVEVQRQSAVVAEASRELREGIDSAQAAAIAVRLAEDVEVVTMHRDTIRGRESVARLLAALGGDSRKRLRVYAGTVGMCSDGRLQEFGGAFTGPPMGSAPDASFTQGAVQTDWQLSGGRAVARRLDFAVGPTANRRASCTLLHTRSAMYQRVIVTAAVDMGQRSPSPVMVTAGTHIDERGFGYQTFPLVESTPGGLTGGVRYRFTPLLSTELQASMRFGERSEGVHPSMYRHIIVSSTPTTLTQLLQLQWGFVRVGAGPSYLFHNFEVDELHERYDQAATARWIRMSDERFTSRSSAPAFGGAAELAVTLPLQSRVILELRAGTGRYGSVDIPGTPNFPAITGVSRSVNTAAFAVGFGW